MRGGGLKSKSWYGPNFSGLIILPISKNKVSNNEAITLDLSESDKVQRVKKHLLHEATMTWSPQKFMETKKTMK
jgi:hypothetical protein